MTEPLRVHPFHHGGMKARTAAVLRFVREFWRINGYGPTLAEIGTGVGMTSKASAAYQVQLLEQMGLIARNPLQPRTIRPVKHAHEEANGRSDDGRISQGPAEGGSLSRTGPQPEASGPEPSMTVTIPADTPATSGRV